MVERIPEPDYREPVIVMAVRELIKDLRDDMNKRLDGIETKLDDRVTVGVFHALRSDLDAALRRIIDTEADIAKLEETGRAVALAKDVAAETLSKETERLAREAEALRLVRAEALQNPARAWGIRGNMAAVAWSTVGILSVSVTLYLTLRG
jgi:tryptophan 2,3-dioxygenase